MSDLNPKQRRFVSEYVKDQNGTQAAIRAGYSKKTAQEQSSQLLSKLMIQSAVQEKLEALSEKSDLKALEVRESVLRLMRFDPRRAFNADGTMKRIHEMPEDVIQAVSGIDADESAGEIKRLRFTDRVRVIELAAKILGMLKFEVSGKDGHPLIPPMPPINFTHIDDEMLKRIAGMGNGAGRTS